MCRSLSLFCVIIASASISLLFFFFNDTATTEIYTLSLHDALPISTRRGSRWHSRKPAGRRPSERFRWAPRCFGTARWSCVRSEEHTSELQSLTNLVCRLLLEKKKNKNNIIGMTENVTQVESTRHQQ